MNKLLPIFFIVLLAGLSAANYHHNQGSIYQDTGFDLPHYDSQEEILHRLVAPFIFSSILLTLLYGKVLHAIFRDKDDNPHALPYREDNKPDVQRYALLMSITTTAIVVPTPFWDYVTFATGSIAIIAATLIMLIFLYGAYSVLKKL